MCKHILAFVVIGANSIIISSTVRIEALSLLGKPGIVGVAPLLVLIPVFIFLTARNESHYESDK
jgi:hypothetical protein